MRSLLGRFHRPMSRGLVNDMLTMNNLGDGSTLSLDFTTGVLDPRLTFSRASNATFVNSSGYVEYAAHNLYYNTNFATISTVGSNPSLTGKGWSYVFSTGSATFNVDGSVTMSASAQRVGLLRSAGFAGTGRQLIFSVDITSVGDTGLPPAQLVNEGTKTNDAYYINGTLWTSGNVVGPCTLSFVFTSNPAGNAATYFGLGMSSNSTATNITFANPRWGFYGGVNQLAYSPNTSATNANYLTAEYHAPRFDYSPTNIGEPRGLLVEGQTTNVCSYSEDFANAAWTKVGIAQTPASGTSPDNSNTATLIAENAGGFIKHSLERSVTVTAGSVYTFSVFLKEASSNSRRYACVQVADGQAVAARNTVVFDLQTGTVTANGVNNGTAGAPTDVAHSITSYRDGWYRVSVTMKYVSSPCYPTVILSDVSTLYGGSNQPFYTATVPYKGLLIWGAQLELGSGASSYIPTGASQVTRNVDNCYMNDISALSYSTTNGTLFYESLTTKWNISSYPARIGFTKQTGDYRSFGALTDVGGMLPNVGGPAGTPTVLVSLPFALNTNTKCAWSFDAALSTAELKATINGGAIVNSTSSALTVSETPTYFGLGQKGYDLYLPCGPVKRVKYWPTTLTAAELQTLTAP